MTNTELQTILDSLAGVRISLPTFDSDFTRLGESVDKEASLKVAYNAARSTLLLESPALERWMAITAEEAVEAAEEKAELEASEEKLEELQQTVRELLACVDKIKGGAVDWNTDAAESLAELREAVKE